MQLLSYLLSALFTVMSLSSAHAQANSNIVLYQMRHANGTSELFSVSETMASKVPDWNPEKGSPPLGIDRATKLAKDWLKKQPKANEFDVSSIKLSRITWPGLNDKWFYLFDCERMIKGYGSTGEDLFIVILMDGTLVPSKKSP